MVESIPGQSIECWQDGYTGMGIEINPGMGVGLFLGALGKPFGLDTSVEDLNDMDRLTHQQWSCKIFLSAALLPMYFAKEGDTLHFSTSFPDAGIDLVTA